MNPPRRILVPMDDTPLSDRALDTALTLAETHGAHLYPVFVRAVPAGEGVAYTDDLDIAAVSAALRGDVTARARQHAVPASRLHPELRTGDPATCILEAAAEHQVDLIVMGTHGRKGLLEQLTGSTTERVLRGTRADMLVLRDRPA